MNIKSKCFIEDEKNIDSLFLAPSKKKKKNKESSKKSLISLVSDLDNSIHSNTSHKCNDIEILIVDDEEINRKVIMNNLSKFKINYETAINGIDCLKKVFEKENCMNCKKFRLIFMDIMMPEMDGIEASQELSKRFNDPNYLNIIIVSAHEVNDIIEKIKGISLITKFLSKPLKMSDLKSTLLDLKFI